MNDDIKNDDEHVEPTSDAQDQTSHDETDVDLDDLLGDINEDNTAEPEAPITEDAPSAIEEETAVPSEEASSTSDDGLDDIIEEIEEDSEEEDDFAAVEAPQNAKSGSKLKPLFSLIVIIGLIGGGLYVYGSVLKQPLPGPLAGLFGPQIPVASKRALPTPKLPTPQNQNDRASRTIPPMPTPLGQDNVNPNAPASDISLGSQIELVSETTIEETDAVIEESPLPMLAGDSGAETEEPEIPSFASNNTPDSDPFASIDVPAPVESNIIPSMPSTDNLNTSTSVVSETVSVESTPTTDIPEDVKNKIQSLEQELAQTSLALESVRKEMDVLRKERAKAAPAVVAPAPADNARIDRMIDAITALEQKVKTLEKEGTTQPQRAAPRSISPAPKTAAPSPSAPKAARTEPSFITITNPPRVIASKPALPAAPEESASATTDVATEAETISEVPLQALPNDKVRTLPYAQQSNVSALSAQWSLKAAQPGTAWLSPRDSQEIKAYVVGDNIPGLGIIQSIQNEGGQWVVRGTIGEIRQ